MKTLIHVTVCVCVCFCAIMHPEVAAVASGTAAR